MYPENPEGTQVISSKLNEHGIYIPDTDTAHRPGIELTICSFPIGSRSH